MEFTSITYADRRVVFFGRGIEKKAAMSAVFKQQGAFFYMPHTISDMRTRYKYNYHYESWKSEKYSPFKVVAF